MKRPSNPVVLYLVLVFLSGLLVGVIGSGLYNARSVNGSTDRMLSPEEMRKRYIEEVRTRLKLTPEQTSKLTAILDNTRESYRELREKYRPEVRAIQEAQVSQIRAILNDAQRQEYEKMREEREKERQRGPHPPGKKGGRGPGPC